MQTFFDDYSKLKVKNLNRISSALTKKRLKLLRGTISKTED